MIEKPIEIHLTPSFSYMHTISLLLGTPSRMKVNTLVSLWKKGEIISTKNLNSYSFKHDYLKPSTYLGRSCIYIEQVLSFVHIIPFKSKLQVRDFHHLRKTFSANVHVMLSLCIINNFEENEAL
jgi:hypothetical protein